MYIKCNTCGERVSDEVPDDIIIRAYVECPECIEKNYIIALRKGQKD